MQNTELQQPTQSFLVAGPSTNPEIGMGCFAGRDFKKDELIGEYTGTILHEEDAHEKHSEAEMEFLFDIGDGLVIDPTDDPNPIKYINHSCKPNCESEQDGKRIYIRATKGIKAGEELFYEYNLQVDEDDEDTYVCKCGSPECKGTRKAQ